MAGKAAELYEVVVKEPMLKEVFRELGRRLGLGQVLDGSKAGNFDGKFIKVTFTSINVEHQVLHGLNRIPIGMIQVSDLQSGSTFGIQVTQTQAADINKIYIKTTVIAPIMFFIW
jgi:hypothetical protein